MSHHLKKDVLSEAAESATQQKFVRGARGSVPGRGESGTGRFDPAAFDPRSPEVKENLEEHFAALREMCPVHHHVFDETDLKEFNENPFVAGPTSDLYSFLKHRDVEEILQSPERFMSIEGSGPERMLPAAGTEMLAWSDGEAHRRSRKIALPSFAPKNVNKIAPRLQEYIDDLIDGFADRGELDLMADFAERVSSAMIAHLVGLPIERAPEILEWGLAIVATFGGDEESYQKGLWSIGKISEFVAEVGPDRVRRMAEGEELFDAVTHLLTATDDDGEHFSHGEAVAAVAQFLGAGIESSATGICNGIHLLCTHSEERAKLAADPSLIGTAVEEILRFRGPIVGTCRTTAEEMNFAGVHLMKGQKIRPVKASANLDEDVFTDAATFKIDRDKSELRKHVAFGSGVHSCLGAALARQEMKLAINTLLRRIPSLALDPHKKPRQSPIFLVRGWVYLPVVWDPATVRPRLNTAAALEAATESDSDGSQP